MLLFVKRVARCFCLFFNATNYEAQSSFQIRRSVDRNADTPERNLPNRSENNTASGQVSVDTETGK